MKLPKLSALYRVIRLCKTEIADEYRACPEDDIPGMQLTVGWDDSTGVWDYQTGDNSFAGAAYHYPIWGVVYIYRSSNCRDLAREIRSQLDEQVY